MDINQAALNMAMLEVRARRAVVENAQRQISERGHFVLDDTSTFAAIDFWVDEMQMMADGPTYIQTPEHAFVLKQVLTMNQEAVTRLLADEPLDQSQVLFRKMLVLNTLAIDLPLTKYLKRILRETDTAEQEMMLAEPNLSDPASVEDFVANGYDEDEDES